MSRYTAGALLMCLMTASYIWADVDTTTTHTKPPSIRIWRPQGMVLSTKSFGDSVKLQGGEFDVVSLNEYDGPVTWDSTVVYHADPTIECKFKVIPSEKQGGVAIGYMAGSTEPGDYPLPESKTAVVYGFGGSGKATIAAWGVDKNGKPFKIATISAEYTRQGSVSPSLPEEISQLQKDLQAAFSKETDPERIMQLNQLFNLYSTKSADAIDGSLTWKGLFDEMVRQRVKVIGMPQDALPKVRRAIGDYFDTKLPRNQSSSMDADGRALALAEFKKVAQALKGVK